MGGPGLLLPSVGMTPPGRARSLSGSQAQLTMTKWPRGGPGSTKGDSAGRAAGGQAPRSVSLSPPELRDNLVPASGQQEERYFLV